MLVGATKVPKELPTQLLNSLDLSEPTGGVPEVWRFRQILFCCIKITK